MLIQTLMWIIYILQLFGFKLNNILLNIEGCQLQPDMYDYGLLYSKEANFKIFQLGEHWYMVYL
jgi:hypothetical protein